ncbi:DUF1127 domain-containing protein [Pseudomonas lopnurensis]|uniref:DUF1127 domain-containing protein n=1 Tax=Pseudomonas lopnurensis TaxID=1477517 RepID=UPI001879CD0F|nr:DUF1127 domain-containing protein [Pseudomonas lopnurensis]MBE7374807.1 DUF1127 domain-containing protein [Pseudomonas lopnurensis]
MNTQKNAMQGLLRLPRTAQAPGPALLMRIWLRVRRWNELSRQRRQLAGLSNAMLKDIGRSRADVEAEAGRPFWDDPEQH